jgi:hypothetical protein
MARVRKCGASELATSLRQTFQKVDLRKTLIGIANGTISRDASRHG